MQVFWHRGDLRAHDDAGLAAAAADAAAELVPVFVFDDAVLAHASDVRVAFMLDALASLRAWYRERGGDLVVRHGDPAAVLPGLAAEYDAERVVWTRDYTGLATERDDAVRAALDAAGVAHEGVHDAVLHEPGQIRTNAGDPYSVFSYYWRKWRDRGKPSPHDPPAAAALSDVTAEPLPSLADLGFETPDVDVPDAGHGAARDRLDAFCSDAIYRYDEAREYPARDGTSRLSQDLAFGTVGVREVYAATGEALADAGNAADGVPDPESGVEAFRRQLAYREFCVQVLAFEPRTVTENYRSFENPIEWRNDPDEIRAWKYGETGFPLVDAGMRQLRSEAWLHNRVRMVVASFLTKDLLADWRVGYRHFREHLVDHDTANDVAGWQWAASTGTDAQPYFRVFNPTTQAADYDPDGEYVRRHVPELADVATETIHAWPDLDPDERAAAAPDYPAPIVDHATRREEAIAAFETARGAG